MVQWFSMITMKITFSLMACFSESELRGILEEVSSQIAEKGFQ